MQRGRAGASAGSGRPTWPDGVTGVGRGAGMAVSTEGGLLGGRAQGPLLPGHREPGGSPRSLGLWCGGPGSLHLLVQVDMAPVRSGLGRGWGPAGGPCAGGG